MTESSATQATGRAFCRKGQHICTPAVTLTFDNGARRLHWCTEHASDADAYRAHADQAIGTTRRIIIDSAVGNQGLEIERSHIDRFAARLTATIGGSGTIIHMTDAELARLVSAGLRLLARNGGDVALNALDAAACVSGDRCAPCAALVLRGKQAIH